MSTKNTIEIDTKTLLKFWLIPAVLALVALFVWHARTGLLIIGASAFLAIAMNSTVGKLSRIFPSKSRTLATAIAYILVVAILGAIIVLVIPPIIEQVAIFIQNASVKIGEVVSSWRNLSESADQYGMKELLENILIALQSTFASFATNIGPATLSSVGSVLSAVTAIILVVVLTFLMLVEGPGLLNVFWASFGENKNAARAKNVTKKIAKVISSFVNGQLLVALIDGSFTAVAVFIFSFIFNVPIGLTIPLGLLAASMSLIPMFGAIIGGVISTTMIAFNDFPAAIFFAVYFVVYQQIESNIIAPAVQSKSSQLPALVILGSVTIGVYLFGLLGAIIAIPVAGIFKVILEELIIQNKSRKAKEESKELEV